MFQTMEEKQGKTHLLLSHFKKCSAYNELLRFVF
jgi:hypothetical protein